MQPRGSGHRYREEAEGVARRIEENRELLRFRLMFGHERTFGMEGRESVEIAHRQWAQQESLRPHDVAEAQPMAPRTRSVYALANTPFGSSWPRTFWNASHFG